MLAIPPAVKQQLYNALARCSPLDSDRALSAIFIDERLAPWRDLVPANTPDRKTRINLLIGALCDQTNTMGDNALILLLHVLGEETHIGDSLHSELLQLAAELKDTPDGIFIHTHDQRVRRIIIAVLLCIGLVTVLGLVNIWRLDRARVLTNAGIISADQGDSEGAKEKFTQALKYNPNYGEAFYQLAKVYQFTDPQKAIDAYESAIEIDAKNGEYHYRLGNLLVDYPDKHPEALKHLNLAKEYAPEDPRVYNELGYLYILMEWWDEAEEELETGIIHSPPPLETGIVLSSTTLETGIALSDTISGVTRSLFKNYGCIALHEGEYDTAISRLTKAIPPPDAGGSEKDARLSSSQADAWLLLAQAYERKGEKAEARVILDNMRERVLNVSPDVDAFQSTLHCYDDN